MSCDKTVQDIIETTGLKYDYIRKCLKNFDEIFKPYIQRGNNNSILFDSNALVIFDRIKQLKEKGYNLTSIEEQLVNKDQLKPSKQKEETPPIQQETGYFELAMKELREAYRQTLTAKDETIQTQKSQIKTLETKILLLTDGRSPEQVKAEQQNKEAEIKRERENFLRVQYEIMENNKRKERIVKSLQSLEGKWFVRHKRKELLEELELLR